MSQYLQDKVTIVTGAGSGFGRIISQKCAAGGARMVGVDIDEDGLKETVASIETAGGTAVGQKADVSSSDDMEAAAKLAIDNYGTIDVIVNNAGIMPLAFFSDHAAALKKWHLAIDVNIKGVVNGIAAVYDTMMSQGRGQVVNIASIYGNAGTQGSGVYSATKAAVEILSNLAADGGKRGDQGHYDQAHRCVRNESARKCHQSGRTHRDSGPALGTVRRAVGRV